MDKYLLLHSPLTDSVLKFGWIFLWMITAWVTSKKLAKETKLLREKLAKETKCWERKDVAEFLNFSCAVAGKQTTDCLFSLTVEFRKYKYRKIVMLYNCLVQWNAGCVYCIWLGGRGFEPGPLVSEKGLWIEQGGVWRGRPAPRIWKWMFHCLTSPS